MDSKEMTRQQLIDWYIETRVQKWGEAEREGVRKQAVRKPTITLQADYDTDHLSSREIMDRAAAKETGPTQYQACGSLDDGPT